mmetsp:Transcript_26262/g.65673  ORF Transcript_26262/g.65673 Transcript_26262/m.65673 type:complete len:84 (-) Transcript_26262:206-457(-)
MASRTTRFEKKGLNDSIDKTSIAEVPQPSGGDSGACESMLKACAGDKRAAVFEEDEVVRAEAMGGGLEIKWAKWRIDYSQAIR